ncbi:hypothetical protein I350_00955 [Cryptococcus amylolentus CBS 6273]|uniref:Uncharacterized protein n=1 Tax=Cryptococcus amylolentus CBS 6273 TaxID=1296118 RepID=A0A1E3KB46_9TREE|nr:hypothetical protein I350_00955 [Cryptococcus amylolentus CBS 6273]
MLAIGYFGPALHSSRLPFARDKRVTPSQTFSSPFANTEVVLKGSVRPGSADVKEGPTRATSHSGSRTRSRELPRVLAKSRSPGNKSESYCESNSAGGCDPLAFIEILRNNTKSRSRAVSGSLRLFAVANLGRCIVERGRRTIFNFWSPDAEPPESSAWSSYLGLPNPLLILLAEIVNLAADLSSSSSASIKAQAGELETAIRTWKAPGIRLQGAGAEEGGVGVGRVVVGEIWRLTCLVLLYQSVHRVGGLHPTLRHARSDILSLLDALVPLPRGDLASSTALPAFLPATLCITKQDRERAMRHLLRAVPEKVWLDNVAVVDKVWEELDGSGVLSDW